MYRMATIVAVLTASVAAATSYAGEIDFVEDFALSRDRTAALKQLIPGTETYYYYHCLHYQNTEQFDKVEQTLSAWIKRYKYTALVREIQNRQALLTYEKNPQKSLEFIRKQLGIVFNHQREILDKKPNLPTSLNQELISRKALTGRAMSRYKNLQGFEDAALDWLVGAELNADRRRHLIERLQRPDYPNLPKLVVDDLNHKYSKGFGAFAIHRQLLLPQLEECLKLKPDLLNQTHFVNVYLTKLQPADDVDWRHDPQEHQAFLDRLWTFAGRLSPAHNSLKAHVLYHRLVFDRSRGIYDPQRFLTYIKLPRNAIYANPKFLKLEQNRRYPANLNADYRTYTLLPVVGNDEPLVRSYLHHFFIKQTTYEAYQPYINDVYLKHNFAETKIVHGLGEAEQWYSMLPPAKYQALKERIDLAFAFTNKTVFSADEPVALDLHVKNVKALFVKVFEINTKNFYREHLREVDTDVNLDGLVANHEQTYKYGEPPLRRIRRHFEFPWLNKPGTYVIDFIGNGKSSRALVRKGKLRYLVRTSTAGHVFTVLDDKNRKLSGATIWLAGHEHKAEGDGTITVPFSTRPGRQPIILSHGNLSSLDFFQHQAENYALTGGIYVDRESLLKRKTATVVIRPSLLLNGTPVTLSVLEDVRLVLTSTDHDGVTTTKEVPGFELFEDRESTYEFQVPQRLFKINFLLKAKVQNLSRNKKIDLAVQQTFSLNEIDRTEKVEDLHFANIGGTYVVDLLGKTGEPKAQRPVQFLIKHRDFRNPVSVTLQSNRQGRIVLGRLQDITSVQATGPQGKAHTWNLLHDRHSYYRSVHGKAGEPVELPYMGRRDKPARSELSLLELRGTTFVADRFDAISIRNGFVHISDLPRGDYDLWLKPSGTRIRLRLTAGERREGYVLSQNRQLEVRGRRPLQIDGIETGKDAVTIRLRNASKFTRVHLFATRYQPVFSAFAHLGRVRDSEPYLMTVPKLESLYVAGRNIGDEYRYIIDRKYAQKYAGNMLSRPSLLLNPWAIRKTATGRQAPAPGESFAKQDKGKEGAAGRGAAKKARVGQLGDFANLDFLSRGSAVLLNLKPDDDGVVTVKREDLGPHQHLHVVAVDPENTAYRTVSLPEVESDFVDLRLADGLDPKVHYTQQKQITVVRKGQKFVLPDITTSKFEAYDSLAKVYSLLATLSRDPKLIEFGFILNWHKMKPAEKRKLYSKHACHELNFFVYKKDREFFNTVVQPYLKNKKDKTFLDRWLLDEDLSEFLEPWNYSQLNIVERILLSQRIQRDREYTSRHVTDLYDLVPPNIDRFNVLFNTALKGSALETGDQFGFDEAKGQVRVGKGLELERLSSPAKKPADAAAENRPTLTEAAPPAAKAARARSKAAVDVLRLQDSRKAAEELADKSNRARDGERRGRRRGGAIGGMAGARVYFERDAKKRKSVRQYFRQLDTTMEWVENNYYKLPIEQQDAKLITVNAFWRDYAHHDPAEPFFSVNLAEASRNFPEMMFAMSFLDIPAEADKHQTDFADAKMTLTPGSPMVVFHQEIKRARGVARATPILVSQNFFRYGDRYRHVNNERVDKYVTDEFLVATVYGCQVVVTNPTSSRQKLDILLQVPVGAIPVSNGQYTRSVHVDLEPYRTKTVDYYFYFPAAGEFVHYPVHVAKNEQLIAHAAPVTLKVVEKLTKIDRESWAYLSQHGSNDDVLAYLKQHNLHRTNLEKIAFRMQDKAFFQTVIGLLTARHAYNHTLWSYGIKHNSVPAIREYLQHQDAFVSRCGSYLDSRLLGIDPVVRKTYQQMDYRPLVNARVHQLGRRRRILNDRFNAQYHRLLKILSYKRELDDDDLMATTYYLLLQDRVEEAIQFFSRVNVQKLKTHLQYDYLAAYLDFYSDEHQLARGIADKYAEHPVDRWRKAFAGIAAQLDEIDGIVPVAHRAAPGGEVQVVDAEDRDQAQTKLAATEASFDFTVEAKKIMLNYQNLDRIRLNYYLMDIELLFSRNPFVQQYSSQFSLIRPNATEAVKLPAKRTSLQWPLPKQFHNSNVLVEVVGAGQRKSQAYYSNSLKLQVIENYGQVRVAHAKTGSPLSKVYVKVYARMKDGRVRFYKDGYTDLRGRFDYASLSTNEIDFVQKFSLLVLSDEFGAVVREANPPKQ